MKFKLKKFLLMFILMIVLDLGFFYLTDSPNFGIGLSPHIGLLFVSGLFFGPYGALSVTLANLICDLIRGYGFKMAAVSFITCFSIAYFPYKLWYEKLYDENYVTKPRLNNIHNLVRFLGIMLACGLVFALFTSKYTHILAPEIGNYHLIGIGYFLNYINFSFLFSIIAFWLSKKVDFIEIPEKTEKEINIVSRYSLSILILITALILISDMFIVKNQLIIIIEIVVIEIILLFYIIKGNKNAITEIEYENSISETIINYFLIITSLIIILGYMTYIELNEISYGLLNADITMLIFFIPSLILLWYMENNVIKPIISFSKINKFIQKDKKIESDALIEIYSEYDEEDNEIGSLARSYTNLIENNNDYIENIREIEGEKERIRAELDIARKIQQSSLPTQAIDNQYALINGFSKPAREVGGDFFDYYQLNDDEIVIVIGDASGKGVPAAIVSTITQVMIQQLLFTESNPAKVLTNLNNYMCPNNPQSMFITLWLGVYNQKTHKLVFSNAGHNPPIIKDGNEFKLLHGETNIVLGVMDGYEYVTEEVTINDEIILYTDGITDLNNQSNEMYGEEKLLEFFNNNQFDENIISKLLVELKNYMQGQEQFDDMTILILKAKK